MKLSPTARLVGRALFVGVVAALGNLQINNSSDTKALVSGAVLAGALAGAEVLTPLNATVGVAKGNGAA